MEVTAEDCERALIAIRNTMRYAIKCYKFFEDKIISPGLEDSEFPIPTNVRLIAKPVVSELCADFPFDSLVKAAVEDDNLEPIFNKLTEILRKVEEDRDIIVWICTCCFFAAKLFCKKDDHHVDFPNMMSNFMYETLVGRFGLYRIQTIRALECRR